ncbi:hypothetical protein ACQPZP_05115 [Spirillospora sp. CA-142024]|uniref:hypothetical protein n=1 Tax=Spirillospora sp. CA-142024 TaxID=3240036 RepID=UPI003D8BF2C4
MLEQPPIVPIPRRPKSLSTSPSRGDQQFTCAPSAGQRTGVWLALVQEGERPDGHARMPDLKLTEVGVEGVQAVSTL